MGSSAYCGPLCIQKRMALRFKCEWLCVQKENGVEGIMRVALCLKILDTKPHYDLNTISIWTQRHSHLDPNAVLFWNTQTTRIRTHEPSTFGRTNHLHSDSNHILLTFKPPTFGRTNHPHSAARTIHIWTHEPSTFGRQLLMNTSLGISTS
jgi:hypothetical protein